VAAIHHSQVHAVVTDLLRNQAQLRIRHFDQILRKRANHRRGARRLGNSSLRSAIPFSGGLRAGIAREDGGRPQCREGVAARHEIPAGVNPTPARETMSIISSIVSFSETDAIMKPKQ